MKLHLTIATNNQNTRDASKKKQGNDDIIVLFLSMIISFLTKYVLIVITMYTYYCTNVFILPSIVLVLLMMILFLKKYVLA